MSSMTDATGVMEVPPHSCQNGAEAMKVECNAETVVVAAVGVVAPGGPGGMILNNSGRETEAFKNCWALDRCRRI